MYDDFDVIRKGLSFVNDALSIGNRVWDTVGLTEVRDWTTPVVSVHTELVARAAIEAAVNTSLTGCTLEVPDINRIAREAAV
jgi:hypothetical protein